MFGYAGFGSPCVDYRTKGVINYRDTTPVAALSEYERYGEGLNHPCARKAFDARRWRRTIIIMRGGESFGCAARLSGLKSNKAAYDKLPDHLK